MQKQTTMPQNHHKLIILGSGPAGYTAALYAARAMLKPVVLKGPQHGGQMTITTDVENYPGFADVIQGPWLMEQMEAQVRRLGVPLLEDTITACDFTQRPLQLHGDSGQLYTSDVVIITTGAKAKWLGLDSEEKFKGYGVSACATCDGFFYRDKKVVVVGGGNTAVEEALFLTNFATQVVVVHRRNELRAEKMLQERVANHEKIVMQWNATVEGVVGTTDPLSVTGVQLRHHDTNTTSLVPTDGLFIAIGHEPATQAFAGQVKINKNGSILTAPDSTATSARGVFAAGDVTDEQYRQAITAAGQGCMAALEAERFLSAL